MQTRILVIDNGGQWTHRVYRVLRYLGCRTRIVANTTPLDEIVAEGVDGLVLSGGAPRIGEVLDRLGNTSEYLDKAEFPILGICVGMQFMAVHYAGKAGPAELPEFGRAELVIDDQGWLFQGLPARFHVWESHNDEVKALGPGFFPLAHSENCRIQAFENRAKTRFGVQFHPEVEHSQFGEDVFRNFLARCVGRLGD